MTEEVMSILRDGWYPDVLAALRQSQERDSMMWRMFIESGISFHPVSWNDEVVPDYLRVPEGL